MAPQTRSHADMDATANPDDSIDSTTILLQKLLSFEVERQQREKEREEREREREIAF